MLMIKMIRNLITITMMKVATRKKKNKATMIMITLKTFSCMKRLKQRAMTSTKIFKSSTTDLT